MSTSIRSTVSAETVTAKTESMSSEHEIEMYYDGACPLCLRETRLLRRFDRNRNIGFVNIAAADFDASAVGKTYDELMSEMHGRLPDGSWVTGVEAFRRFYAAAGFGRAVRLTRLPGLSWLLDRGYQLFARYRLQLTGRCGDCSPPWSMASSDTDPPA